MAGNIVTLDPLAYFKSARAELEQSPYAPTVLPGQYGMPDVQKPYSQTTIPFWQPTASEDVESAQSLIPSQAPLRRELVAEGWGGSQLVDPEAEALIAAQQGEGSISEAQGNQGEGITETGMQGRILADVENGLDPSDPGYLVSWTARMNEVFDKYANSDPNRALDALSQTNGNYRARLSTGPLLGLNGHYTQNLGE